MPKRSRGRIRGDGTGNFRINIKHHRVPKKLRKAQVARIRKALTPISTHTINQLSFATAAMGQQQWVAAVIGDPSMIGSIITAASTAGRQDVLGNVSGTNIPAGNPSASKLNIEDYTLKVEYLNTNNMVHNVTMYELIARHDIPETYASIQAMINTGWSAAYPGTAPSNAVAATTLGVSLFQNPVVTSYFKIANVKKFTVGPGNSFITSIKENRPRVINPLVYNAAELIGVAGYTRVIVFCFCGSLANDENVETHLNIAQAQAELRSTEIINYNAVAPSQSIKTYYQTGFTALTAGNQQIMNPKQGIPQGLESMFPVAP